jgi:heat shock protein HtpX
MLNRGELEGVMAHEMSHIKNKDILIMSVVVVMASVLSTLANFAMHASFVGDKREGNNMFMLIVGVVASLIIPIAAVIVQSSISRKREFVADAGGALLTSYPEGLASALEKISGYKQPTQIQLRLIYLYLHHSAGLVIRHFSRDFSLHIHQSKSVLPLFATRISSAILNT